MTDELLNKQSHIIASNRVCFLPQHTHKRARPFSDSLYNYAMVLNGWHISPIASKQMDWNWKIPCVFVHWNEWWSFQRKPFSLQLLNWRQISIQKWWICLQKSMNQHQQPAISFHSFFLFFSLSFHLVRFVWKINAGINAALLFALANDEGIKIFMEFNLKLRSWIMTTINSNFVVRCTGSSIIINTFHFARKCNYLSI